MSFPIDSSLIRAPAAALATPVPSLRETARQVTYLNR